MPSCPVVALVPARTAEHLATAHTLFQEYAEQLNIDLAFQDFQEELETLPGAYAPPTGELLLAQVDGMAAGCCALRPIADVDYPDAAELKRLYVRRAFRGFGIGRQLAARIVEHARHIDYRCVLLDTLDNMEAARALYMELGFEEIPPYYHNPIRGAHYLKVDLR